MSTTVLAHCYVVGGNAGNRDVEAISNSGGLRDNLVELVC